MLPLSFPFKGYSGASFMEGDDRLGFLVQSHVRCWFTFTLKTALFFKAQTT